MFVRWSARAESEFNAIFAYIAGDGESIATKQVRLILAATRQLERFPQSGRQTPKRSTGILSVSGTPYLIVYDLRKDVVELISIRHGAMRP